ncbi:MAG: hypothetical protein J5529_12250 [Prevotella sp.]|nr:hypothetical protein [Prevotella sp.]
MELIIEKILEYQDIFPNDVLNVEVILRKYSREKIVKTVNCLSMNYGNAYIPDENNTFFSEISKEKIKKLNIVIGNYLKQNNISKVCYCTQRSILELLRYTFSIPQNLFENSAKNENLEYDMFKILLYINQDLMKFSSKEDNSTSLVFLHNYILNDITNGNYNITYHTQIWYFNCLLSFLNENDKGIILKDLYLQKVGITSLRHYIQTLVYLFYIYIETKSKNIKGCPVLYFDFIKDKTRFLHREVCDYLSLDINEIIPYSSDNDAQRDNNVDYREFRAHPLIKLSDGKYIIYNLQLLCERIYNGLFFDIKQVWSNKDGDYFQFYNKEVIEHFLFQRTILKCVGNKTTYYYPSKQDILLPNVKDEQDNQPDFYIREKDSLILFECKGVKINGSIKDKADADELIRTIKNKLYLSTENTDKKRKAKRKKEFVGVTQLVKLINSIEDDNFFWDSNIPNDVDYYPVLVLEDPRLSQMGMMKLLNEWYKPLLAKENLTDTICHPLIVMSIDTLFRYSEVFKQKGFHYIFNEFFKKNCKNIPHLEWDINPLADFDMFMRQNFKMSSNKKKYYTDIISRITDK